MKVKVLLALNKRWYAFLTPLIRSVEASNYSHVAIQEEMRVLESVWPKARSIHIFDWKNTYQVQHLYELELNPMEKEMFIEKAEELVGKKYTLFQLIMILFKRKLGIKLSDGDGENRLVCSEMFYLSAVHARIVDGVVDSDYIGLKETKNILDHLVRNGKAVKIK